MKIVNARQMREIDRLTIEVYGLPSLVLMERAGLSVAGRIKERYGASRRVLVFSGRGNNGGDGLVVARLLHNEGLDVRVFMTSTEGLSGDCRRQYEVAGKMGVRIIEGRLPTRRETSGAVVVDAVIGTGLSKVVKDDTAKVIERINSSGADGVVAVDVPTGISSDTAEVMGVAVRADVTVTFGLPKVGHLMYPGAEYTGRLFVEDIGFPRTLLESDDLSLELLEGGTAASFLPERRRDTHKGDYGKVLVVGGSMGKTGAALLSARSALRSGSGLVTVAVPEGVIGSVMASVLEEMTLPLPSTPAGGISREALRKVGGFLGDWADVLAVGPGLGREEETVEFLLGLLTVSPVPVVIDADGLFALSTLGCRRLVRFLRGLDTPAVLTPHTGEMARLVGLEVPDIRKRMIEVATEFAVETGCCLVLKGVPVVVASPDGRSFVNPTGNPGMATAGTGDVLTGMIASFVGQGLSVLEASLLGVYLHGLAGDLAAGSLTEHSLTAAAVIDALPEAFRSLKGLL